MRLLRSCRGVRTLLQYNIGRCRIGRTTVCAFAARVPRIAATAAATGMTVKVRMTYDPSLLLVDDCESLA